MPLFEVCVLHEADKKKDEEVVQWPNWVLAKDERSAAFQFIMDLTKGEQREINHKRAKILVRPF